MMSRKRLTGIFLEHEGYVSDKWEQYLGIYDRELARFAHSDQPVRLLEIGVQNGGSLQIWEKYLPLGSSIVGLDIDQRRASFPSRMPRCRPAGWWVTPQTARLTLPTSKVQTGKGACEFLEDVMFNIQDARIQPQQTMSYAIR